DLSFQSITALLMIVNLAAFPITVRAVDARGHQGAAMEIRTHGNLLLLLALPATVGLAVLAPNVATVLVGEQFRAASMRILPVVAVAALLSGLKAYYFDLSYQLGGRTSVQVWTSGAAALTNVLLNVLLIPRYGSIGAAWSTLIAYLVGCIFSWRL